MANGCVVRIVAGMHSKEAAIAAAKSIEVEGMAQVLNVAYDEPGEGLVYEISYIDPNNNTNTKLSN